MDGMSVDLSKYGSASFVADVLNRGKKEAIGTMPKFNDGRLNDIQQKAVGEYVISLSKGRIMENKNRKHLCLKWH